MHILDGFEAPYPCSALTVDDRDDSLVTIGVMIDGWMMSRGVDLCEGDAWLFDEDDGY
ncbi:hypothetical protein C7446_2557 [Kushneria sinocarnis]|uniref:Uncharacterized protein n=1 Tax=Kushneria sinocarnis TaxID=595502 RepID=A0A420WUL3_9GAMM|nr:hypothetical protein [Kushneria sinocarnis]RKQ97137.1 hypothetical protein C7446_2557 [Kushneria sinocarnis]